MSEKTGIHWTDHTFNPWWGCIKVSDGCANCYAETFAKRTGHAIWGPPANTSRRLFGDKHWADPLKWNRDAEQEGRRHRVFCASMADVFEDHPQVVDERHKLWDLIEETRWLDWQLLTKRPENVVGMVPPHYVHPDYDWPARVWIGTSVEHQAAAEQRIPILLSIPATVRFLSCEPLLGPLNLRDIEVPHDDYGSCCIDALGGEWAPPSSPPVTGTISWIIVGGESGPKHRPFNLDWARSLRDQCQESGTAFFFKQAGGLYPGRDRELDGQTWDEMPQVAGEAV